MESKHASAQTAYNRLVESRDRLTDAETIIVTWIDNQTKRSILRDLSDAFDSIDTLMLKIKG